MWRVELAWMKLYNSNGTKTMNVWDARNREIQEKLGEELSKEEV